MAYLDVSTHAPLRGATSLLALISHGQTVSTHAPLRGATGIGPECGGHHYMFQPTHPCGVRLIGCGRFGVVGMRFNPRTPAGCDAAGVPYAFVAVVSTHAPLRGATRDNPRSADVFGVSTHAPLRGATGCQLHLNHDLAVSTHAPLRGATVGVAVRFTTRLRFQPTHPCGVRPPAL